MTRIESDVTIINKPQEKVYDFLNDLNNFEKLMPEQVINWKSGHDWCSFTIKGMADVSMKITERVPFSKILLTADDNVPLKFTLECELKKIKDSETAARINMDAELNAMMEMLAKRPLQNFVNMLSAKLKELEGNF